MLSALVQVQVIWLKQAIGGPGRFGDFQQSAGKLKEFLIAKRLEKALSKDRIFALYLNVIELGPNVFGVQAAARHWFGKGVGELSLEEMVRLTAIMPRPLSSDPRANDAWMKFKGHWIAETLAAVKAIGEDERKALVAAFE